MQKTKLDLLTVCDYANISQDNKLSILGMFDQIFVGALPTQHSQFYIVGILSGEPNKTENITMEIKNPSGSETIPTQKLDVKIGPNGKSNIIAAIGNLPINEVGFYKIVIRNKSGVIGEKEFGAFQNPGIGPASKPGDKYPN